MQKVLPVVLLAIIIFMLSTFKIITPNHGKIEMSGTSIRRECSGYEGEIFMTDIKYYKNECRNICIDYVFFEDGMTIVKEGRECESWETTKWPIRRESNVTNGRIKN